MLIILIYKLKIIIITWLNYTSIIIHKSEKERQPKIPINEEWLWHNNHLKFYIKIEITLSQKNSMYPIRGENVEKKE